MEAPNDVPARKARPLDWVSQELNVRWATHRERRDVILEEKGKNLCFERRNIQLEMGAVWEEDSMWAVKDVAGECVEAVDQC